MVEGVIATTAIIVDARNGKGFYPELTHAADTKHEDVYFRSSILISTNQVD
ncbi:hypothetical protein ACSYAD_09335 [Acaryochloris marina NIES-2412]|uniref:hypothetical protein n=1 Tax=Acaryochloris marina TaxID=155978 RepID=UPI0040597803